jgi:threonine/homoserine/homoserine lactone efflux protein
VIAGCRVAVSPLLSDAPIVLAAVTLLVAVPSGAVTALSIAGSLVLIGLGLAGVRDARTLRLDDAIPVDRPQAGSRWRGAAANLVSPHPGMFWVGVGAPLVLTGAHDEPMIGVLFVVAFYSVLVGSKVAIAVAVARARLFLTPRATRTISTGSGAVMMIFGGWLLINATLL